MTEDIIKLFGQPIQLIIDEKFYNKEDSDLKSIFPPGVYTGYYVGQDIKNPTKQDVYLYDVDERFRHMNANWWRGQDPTAIVKMLKHIQPVDTSYENYISKKDILPIVQFIFDKLYHLENQLDNFVDRFRDL